MKKNHVKRTAVSFGAVLLLAPVVLGSVVLAEGISSNNDTKNVELVEKNPSLEEGANISGLEEMPQVDSNNGTPISRTAEVDRLAEVSLDESNGNTVDRKVSTLSEVFPEYILLNCKQYVEVGETVHISVEFHPENTTNKFIEWEVATPHLADITQDGDVTIKAPGVVQVYAYPAAGEVGSIQLFATEKTTPSEVRPESVTIHGWKSKIKVGESLQLSATVEPENTTDKTVSWTISDGNIADIDQSGLVTGIAPGTVEITAISSDGNVVDTVDIEVEKDTIIPPIQNKLNLANLESAINEAKSKKQAEYTVDSWSNLSKVVTAAEKVLADAKNQNSLSRKLIQSDIDEEAAKVKRAIAALVKVDNPGKPGDKPGQPTEPGKPGDKPGQPANPSKPGTPGGNSGGSQTGNSTPSGSNGRVNSANKDTQSAAKASGGAVKKFDQTSVSQTNSLGLVFAGVAATLSIGLASFILLKPKSKRS